MPVNMPGWVAPLMQAAEWGIPPWRVEDECPPIWDLRWRAYQAELAAGTRERRRHE